MSVSKLENNSQPDLRSKLIIVAKNTARRSAELKHIRLVNDAMARINEPQISNIVLISWLNGAREALKNDTRAIEGIL